MERLIGIGEAAQALVVNYDAAPLGGIGQTGTRPHGRRVSSFTKGFLRDLVTVQPLLRGHVLTHLIPLSKFNALTSSPR